MEKTRLMETAAASAETSEKLCKRNFMQWRVVREASQARTNATKMLINRYLLFTYLDLDLPCNFFFAARHATLYILAFSFGCAVAIAFFKKWFHSDAALTRRNLGQQSENYFRADTTRVQSNARAHCTVMHVVNEKHWNGENALIVMKKGNWRDVHIYDLFEMRKYDAWKNWDKSWCTTDANGLYASYGCRRVLQQVTACTADQTCSASRSVR